MFDNCWTYNKKNTRVYKMGMKLSEVFDVHIDEAMVKLGYCCGRRVSTARCKVLRLVLSLILCSMHLVLKCSTATVEMSVPFLGMPLIGAIKTGVCLCIYSGSK